MKNSLDYLDPKGVIIIMLSQGVEDYKTKDFDFASQVKLPICLNVQNKDYKSPLQTLLERLQASSN